jgi:hypothetical protein
MAQERAHASTSIIHKSIPRHFGIDELGPGINTAAHGLRLAESMLAQPVGGTLASHAVVAIDDDVLIHIREALRGQLAELGERHQLGIREATDLPFVLLAAVDDAPNISST